MIVRGTELCEGVAVGTISGLLTVGHHEKLFLLRLEIDDASLLLLLDEQLLHRLLQLLDVLADAVLDWLRLLRHRGLGLEKIRQVVAGVSNWFPAQLS